MRSCSAQISSYKRFLSCYASITVQTSRSGALASMVFLVVSINACRSPSSLVNNPSCLFVDEPTSGLDSTTAAEVVQTLSDAQLYFSGVGYECPQFSNPSDPFMDTLEQNDKQASVCLGTPPSSKKSLPSQKLAGPHRGTRHRQRHPKTSSA